MASPQKWFAKSQAEVASFFGVSLAVVTGAWSARSCPLVKTDAGYDLGEIARWRVSQDRPSNSHSEAIDELRDLNIRMKKLDLAEREKRLVDISEVTGWLGRLAAVIRDAITRLENQYGFAAGDIMRHPLERMTEEIRIHGGDGDSASDQGGKSDA